MAAEVAEDDTAETAQARILGLLDPDDAERDQIAARVAAAIGLTSAQVPVSELFWGIRRLFEALAADQPLIVLFDDIHDAAPTFLELLDHLVESSKRVPIVLVCSARHELLEEHPDWEGRPGTATIKLEPLTAADAELFIDRLLGETAVPDEVRRRVVEAAEGNPLYVEQMVRMLADERVGSASDMSEFVVPPSIQALIAARLDLLSREERAIVEPASVIGLVFPEPAVHELVPEPLKPALGQHLTTLSRKQFVRPADGGMAADDSDTYRFHHILIRDTAYNALLKRARATLHERFVAWAEQVNRERDREQEFEEILGYHLEQAFRYRAELGPIDAEGRQIGTRAAQRLGAAGRRAFARGDLPAATNLLARAAALREAGDPERIELLVDLGEAQLEQGTFAEATATPRRGGDGGGRDRGCPAGGPRHPQQADTSRSMPATQRASPRALEAAANAIPIFEAAGDRAGLARAWRLRVVVHGTAGRYDEAAAAAERVVEYAVGRRGRADGGTRRPDLRVGRPGRDAPRVGSARALRAASMAQVAGDRKSEAIILGVLAQVYAMQGDFARAREESERQRQMLAELGPSVTAMSTSIERARVESLAGDLAAAERELRADDAALAEHRRTLLPVDGRRDARRASSSNRAGSRMRRRPSRPPASWPTRTMRCPRSCGEPRTRDCWPRQTSPMKPSLEAESAVALATDGDDIDLLGDVKSALGEVLWRAGRRDMAEPPLREALALYERKEDVASASRVRLRLEALASGADPTAVG